MTDQKSRRRPAAWSLLHFLDIRPKQHGMTVNAVTRVLRIMLSLKLETNREEPRLSL